MASESSILREYAFQLGWKIDTQSFRQYDKIVKDTDNAILAVGASLTAVAVASALFVDKVSSNMEKLYFATRRTGTTAAEFQQFGLAVRNAGGSAEGAAQSLQNLGAFLRNTPSGKGWLEAHGVDPKNIGDAKKELDDLRKHWLNVPRWLAGKEAQIVGVDDQTLNALLDPEYKEDHSLEKAYKMFGMNADEATKKAHEFQVELRDQEQVFVAFGQWLETDLAGPFKQLMEYMDKSLVGLQKFITIAQSKGVGAALDDAVGGHQSVGAVAGMYWDRLKQWGSAQINLDKISEQSYLAGPRVDPTAAANQQLKDSLGAAYGRHTAFAGTNDPAANAKAQVAYDRLVADGIPSTQAIGMVGASWLETGGTFDPTKFNSDGGGQGARGAFQIRGDRIKNFVKKYGHDPLKGTLNEQLDFAASEILSGNEKAGAGDFMSANDPGAAGRIFEHNHQRPGSSIADGRAEGYANHVAVTVHIHGNADGPIVHKAVTSAVDQAAAKMTSNFK